MRLRPEMIRLLCIITCSLLVCWSGLPGTVAAAKEKQPATEAAQKVMDTLVLVEQKMTATRYQHATVVNVKKGIFYWDCSGMTEWVMRKAAPKARKSLPKKHPLAREFYDRIAGSPTDMPKKGWLKLTRPEEIRPGDVFAWRKPWFWKKRKSTGHVGFVIGTPKPHPEYAGVWLMRIADSSRYLHENDSRPDDGTGGYGTGTIAFLFDKNGKPLSYGWYGSVQSPDTFVPTKITFGRLTK